MENIDLLIARQDELKLKIGKQIVLKESYIVQETAHGTVLSTFSVGLLASIITV